MKIGCASASCRSTFIAALLASALLIGPSDAATVRLTGKKEDIPIVHDTSYHSPYERKKKEDNREQQQWLKSGTVESIVLRKDPYMSNADYAALE